MKTKITATFRDGVLKPDTALDLPEAARVTVTVESTEETESESTADWKTRQREGLEKLKQRNRDTPIGSGGGRFTRDELHERD